MGDYESWQINAFVERHATLIADVIAWRHEQMSRTGSDEFSGYELELPDSARLPNGHYPSMLLGLRVKISDRGPCIVGDLSYRGWTEPFRRVVKELRLCPSTSVGATRQLTN